MDSDKLPIVDHEKTDENENEGSVSRLPVQDSVESTDLPDIKVYTRRWYILGLFGLLACHQCVVWNTFGPIESAVQYAYGWSDSEAPMLANWGCIMFVLTSVPLTKLAEKNLRVTVVLVSGFVALGTVLRCCHYLINNKLLFRLSCHACAILNGVSGVTIMAAPPLISSQWFPPDQRTTATSINQAANMLGNGVAMLVGPALVNLPKSCNISAPTPADCPDRADIQRDVDDYMLISAAVAVALFLLFCLYFPAKPPLPPAPSSAIQRTEFWTGARQIFRNRSALLICFAYSMGGVMGSWLSVMVNNFGPLNVTDKQIGLIGLFAVFGQCALVTATGLLIDRLKHKMKITLVVLISLATAGFVWLTLICIRVAPFNLGTLYTAVILSSSISAACYPIFFEMCVEVTYPVHESIVGGFLTTFYNVVGIIFLLLFFIPYLEDHSVWVNYVLVGATFVSLPAILLTKETYNRSNIDEAATSPDY